MRCSKLAVTLSSTVLLLSSMASQARATVITYDVDLQSSDAGISVTGTVLFDTVSDTVTSTDLTLFSPPNPAGDVATFAVTDSNFYWSSTPSALTFVPIQFGDNQTGANAQIVISDSYGFVDLDATNSNAYTAQRAAAIYYGGYGLSGGSSLIFAPSFVIGTATPVPEPGNLAIAGLALGFWLCMKRKREVKSVFDAQLP